MEKTKLKENNYFVAKQETPNYMLYIAVALIIIGVVLYAVVVNTGEISVMIAAFALWLVGVLALMQKKSVFLTGEEYDLMVNEKLARLSSDARDVLGLDSTEVEEIAPISFEGYKFAGRTKIRKDNKDQIWRSDLYEKVIIFFTQNEIHLYKQNLNTLTEKVIETTDVMFYDDVVSVATKSEVEKVGNQTIEYISFNLVSKGGNSVSIALRGDDSRQRSVNAMRAMIKEKKMS